MTFSRLFSPLFLLAALTPLAGPAAAQDGREPVARPAPSEELTINAVAYAPLTGRRAPVTVRLYDDSAEDIALRAKLEEALRADGWTVQETGAPLVLSFQLSTGDMGIPRPHTGILRLEGSTGTSVDAEYNARLNLYSSTESSLLAGPDAPSDSPVTRPTVRYQLDLSDTRDGRRLWSGWATTTLRRVQTGDAAAAMIPPLVAAMGETVRNRQETIGAQ